MQQAITSLAGAIIIAVGIIVLIFLIGLIASLAMGLVLGIAPPPRRIDINGLQCEQYMVTENDTIVSIAVAHDQNWKELMELNGMTEPQQLKPGMRLMIPTARNYNS